MKIGVKLSIPDCNVILTQLKTLNEFTEKASNQFETAMDDDTVLDWSEFTDTLEKIRDHYEECCTQLEKYLEKSLNLEELME